MEARKSCEETKTQGFGGTKICPRCGEELFGDMDVCFGCLYDFRHTPECNPLEIQGPARETEGERSDSGMSEVEVTGADETLDLGMALRSAPDVTSESLWMRSADIEVVIPVSRSGLIVGRSPQCDIVLHSLAVSRRHVRFRTDGDDLIVENLGAKNLADLGGREIFSSMPVPPGHTVNVCGTLFTYVVPNDGSEIK